MHKCQHLPFIQTRRKTAEKLS